MRVQPDAGPRTPPSASHADSSALTTVVPTATMRPFDVETIARSPIGNTVPICSAPLSFAGWLLIYYSWREAFVWLSLLGIAWASWFFWWFRDKPSQKSTVNQAEIDVPAKKTVVPAEKPATLSKNTQPTGTNQPRKANFSRYILDNPDSIPSFSR